MNESMARLLESTTRLLEDAVAGTLGLCGSDHTSSSPALKLEKANDEPPAEPAGFKIAVHPACVPAYLGTGMVRVGVTPPNSDVAVPPIHVQRVNPGFTQMPTRPNPATADSPLPGGASHVDVTLSAFHESVGLYWGRVLASGGIDSPFFIYLDGLP